MTHSFLNSFQLPIGLPHTLHLNFHFLPGMDSQVEREGENFGSVSEEEELEVEVEDSEEEEEESEEFEDGRGFEVGSEVAGGLNDFEEELMFVRERELRWEV